MNLRRSLAAVTLVALCALPAVAQDTPKRPLLGLNLGVYLPTNGKARDAFGPNFFNIGFGLGRFRTPTDKGAFGFDFSIIANRSVFSGGDNRAVLIPLGVVYARRMTPATSDVEATGWTPYVGASANLIVSNLRSDKYDVESKWRAGAGGSVFIGGVWKGTYSIQARYYGMTSVEGLNLSGLNLTTGFRF
jgi:hypothetical protein